MCQTAFKPPMSQSNQNPTCFKILSNLDGFDVKPRRCLSNLANGPLFKPVQNAAHSTFVQVGKVGLSENRDNGQGWLSYRQPAATGLKEGSSGLAGGGW